MNCSKSYVLPTNKWLKPLKLLHKDNNLVMTSELVNKLKKEKVIVKITKINSFITENLTEYVYNIIKDSVYVVKIYCFLNCNENPKYLSEEYKDILGFCNTTSSNENKQIINLEIMKKYKQTLKTLEDECNLKTILIILKQLLLIQLELFDKYQFVHNDIHLANIFIEKIEKETKIIYDINIKTIFDLYLTDFEYSLILSKKLNPNINLFFNSIKDNENSKKRITLEKNINDTFYNCILLLKDEKLKKDLLHKLHNIERNIEYANKRISYFALKNINYYYINRREEEIKDLILRNSYQMIFYLYKILFNENF
jgi:hypothetical protein